MGKDAQQNFLDLLAQREKKRGNERAQAVARDTRKKKVSNAFLEKELEQRAALLEAWIQVLELINEGQSKEDVLWAFLKAYDTPNMKTISLEGKEKHIDFIELDLVKWLRSGQPLPEDLYTAYVTSIQKHYGHVEVDTGAEIWKKKEAECKREERAVHALRQNFERLEQEYKRKEQHLLELDKQIKRRFPFYARLGAEYKAANDDYEAQVLAFQEGVSAQVENASNDLTMRETELLLKKEELLKRKKQQKQRPAKEDERLFWLTPLGLQPRDFPMVTVAKGKHWRGGFEDPITQPAKQILLDSFSISPSLVTQALFLAVEDEFVNRESGLLKPLTRVSWEEAITFCNALSDIYGYKPAYVITSSGDVRWKTERNGFRLPTEAEWEAAARAQQSGEFAGGDQHASVAWTAENALNSIKTVRRKRCNEWGLYDMSGLVWEWVWDGFSPDYYAHSPKENPMGPAEHSKRVIRGGSVSSHPDRARVWVRASAPPKAKDAFLGFRLARNP